MGKKKPIFDISSAGLHVIAMFCMLWDHAAASLVYSTNDVFYDTLRIIGRIAFPIFAFMTAEGFFYTSNLKKYALRLLAFALVSEIPFNLLISGGVIYPFHQNVLFTFLMALGAMWVLEKAKQAKAAWLKPIAVIGVVALSYLLGTLTFADYYGGGILTVLVFYFFREKKWYNLLGQIAALLYINVEVLGGYGYSIEIMGNEIFLPLQAFALLALIPIWLYNGRKGHSSKAFKYACYAFYPVHMLVLFALMLLL